MAQPRGKVIRLTGKCRCGTLMDYLHELAGSNRSVQHGTADTTVKCEQCGRTVRVTGRF